VWAALPYRSASRRTNIDGDLRKPQRFYRAGAEVPVGMTGSEFSKNLPKALTEISSQYIAPPQIHVEVAISWDAVVLA
jgi:hypothetical protein